MVPSITPWMPSVWLPEVSWSAAKTSTVTAPPVASLTIWPKSRPMSAQQVFSVAEQVYFQVIFSNWGASLPPSAAGASLLAGASEPPPLPPQAARERHMANVMSSARNFFICFPPLNNCSCVYLISRDVMADPVKRPSGTRWRRRGCRSPAAAPQCRR